MIARLRRWWSLDCPDCGEPMAVIFRPYCFNDQCRKSNP